MIVLELYSTLKRAFLIIGFGGGESRVKRAEGGAGRGSGCRFSRQETEMALIYLKG